MTHTILVKSTLYQNVFLIESFGRIVNVHIEPNSIFGNTIFVVISGHIKCRTLEFYPRKPNYPDFLHVILGRMLYQMHQSDKNYLLRYLFLCL